MATVTDPVCGMQVDTSQAAAQAMHNGQQYFFCAEECRDKFLADPHKYINDKHSSDSEPIPLP